MDLYAKEADSLRRPQSAEWLRDAFLNTVTRKVKGDATISYQNVYYDVPAQFIGEKVTVRYLPGDMTSAHIVAGNKTHPLYPTDKVANSKTPREKSRYTVPYSDKGGESDASCQIPA
jgi:hypothetical protein